MGSLIALEMASSRPERIKAISMIGTAFPMQVNEALLESAKSNPQIAINILTVSYTHLTLPTILRV